MSVPRGLGRGLDGIPMEGMFVEIDRDRSGILTHGKRQSMYCQYSDLLISLSFSPFRVSSKKIRLCSELLNFDLHTKTRLTLFPPTNRSM